MILGRMSSLGSSGAEEFAQFAQQVKENEEDVLHRCSLRSVAMLGKPADTPFNRSSYEFAIDRCGWECFLGIAARNEVGLVHARMGCGSSSVGG